MTTGKYVSTARVIEKLYRDHGFVEQASSLDIAEWIGDALGLMGVISYYERDIACVDIEDYRGQLPDNLITVYAVRVKSPTTQAMRYSGDPFFIKMHCPNSPSLTCKSEATYQLNNDFIFTSFEEGTVEIAYDKLPIGEDNLPLIPDNAATIEAMTWYVAYKIAYKLWLQERMTSEKLKYIEREKDWYVGKAIGKGKMPSIDQMETFKNMTLRLIPKVNDHINHFNVVGSQEKRYNHNNGNFNQGDRSN